MGINFNVTKKDIADWYIRDQLQSEASIEINLRNTLWTISEIREVVEEKIEEHFLKQPIGGAEMVYDILISARVSALKHYLNHKKFNLFSAFLLSKLNIRRFWQIEIRETKFNKVLEFEEINKISSVEINKISDLADEFIDKFYDLKGELD